MTVRTVNTLPAATHDERVRCLFAIELSKQSWVIGFNTPLSAKISRRVLSGGDWKGLFELIEEVRARVSRAMDRAVEVMSCYEAGYDGFWLHRQLEAHGVRNYVIDPASVQVDRRMRRVKTDRIDNERLLRSLMAYLRGEPKVWSVVRVPSVAEEDARRLHRERDRLVSERVQHVNRIKGLCALQGIYDYHPLRPQAMARVEQLRTAQGIALPPRLKSEIKGELQRLELVVEMIATLEAERDAIVEDESSAHLNAKKIQHLHKLKAIGPEFAAVLVGEIFHRDFNNRRQLASYVGFAPSPFQSGNVAHDQGISKAGNRKGRTTGIELAWLWLRYQPDSDLSVWFRTRVGTVKGRIRRIAIVALARKLLVALWRYLETGLVLRGAVLKG
ncbi:MAG TPA: IS110 family transposase [Xanthobacteraceae bacterium]|nr:IS110 family transposase [Xanthobacteraceae bacterium]